MKARIAFFTSGRDTRSTPCHDVGDHELLVLRARGTVESARGGRVLPVVATGDEESRSSQLPRGGERVHAAEACRPGQVDDPADRRPNARSGGDNPRSPHRGADEHDFRRAATSELLRGSADVAVRIEAVETAGGPVAAHVEHECTVALRDELAREREPLAAVAGQLVREDDARLPATERSALEPDAVRGAEADVRRDARIRFLR